MTDTWTVAGGFRIDDVLASFAAGRVVYAPVAVGPGRFRLERAERWEPGRHTLAPYRPVEPLRSLLSPPREHLGAWGRGDAPPPAPDAGERLVVGVKACDLASLSVQDPVFLEGACVDPGYAAARERTVLVASDCVDHLDACFCTAVGGRPHPASGFDVNVSPVEDRYCISSGSERGDALIAAAGALLEPAGRDLVEARDRRRAALAESLTRHVANGYGLEPGQDLRAAVEGAWDSGLWQTFAEDCVECGACNFVCCTCHCFALGDGRDRSGRAARWKQWDGCLLPGFAATAGGGSPLHTRAARLRNRFEKKFVYFPQVLGRYACNGCGRCTEACIGRIDIRAVLGRAVDETAALHADPGDDRAG